MIFDERLCQNVRLDMDAAYNHKKNLLLGFIARNIKYTDSGIFLAKGFIFLLHVLHVSTRKHSPVKFLETP